MSFFSEPLKLVQQGASFKPSRLSSGVGVRVWKYSLDERGKGWHSTEGKAEVQVSVDVAASQGPPLFAKNVQADTSKTPEPLCHAIHVPLEATKTKQAASPAVVVQLANTKIKRAASPANHALHMPEPPCWDRIQFQIAAVKMDSSIQQKMETYIVFHAEKGWSVLLPQVLRPCSQAGLGKLCGSVGQSKRKGLH